ncbi:MAG: hypothetical protein R3213_09340 [Flavobacteriaceae bacterium]|nr:hypothetical protein [Flavobacteriaceae bacterium]
MDLTPLEPTLSATDLKKKLYECVKELDAKAGKVIPHAVPFMLGKYSVYRDLYFELTTQKPTDDEIRSWKNEFDLPSNGRKSS